MGSRGQTSRYGGGGGSFSVGSSDSLISARERKQSEVDEVLSVLRDVDNKYGMIVTDARLAELTGRGAQSTLAYWQEGVGNIGVNINYFSDKRMAQAQAEAVAIGFHPTNGNKSAMESVIAHEMGHALTSELGKRWGLSLDAAADRVAKEAVKNTSHRGVVQMAKAISTYATHSNAEGIAEAFADVYCNGNNAKAESKAIIGVVDKYLLGGTN